MADSTGRRTSHPSSGTTCPRSGSHVAHYENSTGGTALGLRQGSRYLQCPLPILHGFRDTAAQIFAIFEGYVYGDDS